MADSIVIAAIVAGAAVIATIGWKVLDIGKRAMELERTTSRGD